MRRTRGAGGPIGLALAPPPVRGDPAGCRAAPDLPVRDRPRPRPATTGHPRRGVHRLARCGLSATPRAASRKPGCGRPPEGRRRPACACAIGIGSLPGPLNGLRDSRGIAPLSSAGFGCPTLTPRTTFIDAIHEAWGDSRRHTGLRAIGSAGGATRHPAAPAPSWGSSPPWPGRIEDDARRRSIGPIPAGVPGRGPLVGPSDTRHAACADGPPRGASGGAPAATIQPGRLPAPRPRLRLPARTGLPAPCGAVGSSCRARGPSCALGTGLVRRAGTVARSNRVGRGRALRPHEDDGHA